ncbi:MAG: hypothetical protein WCK05_03185, partial [Planctomycetota bacterium]
MSEHENRKDARHRRRWFARGRAAGIVLAAVVGVGYASLPLWLPESLVAARIARDLSAQTGVPVQIGSLSLNWSGVEIRDLDIDPPASFDPARKLLHVETLHTEFSPIAFLLGRPLDWLSLEKVTVFLQADRVAENLAPLRRLKDEPAPDRVNLHDGKVVLRFPRSVRATAPASQPSPGGEQVLVVSVADLDWTPGGKHQVGKVTVDAALLQDNQGSPAAKAPFKLSVGPADNNVTAGFAFADVDLARVRDLIDLPVRDLSGRCSGQLDLRYNKEGVIDRLTCQLKVLGLSVRGASGPPVTATEASVDLTATIDSYAGKLDVQSLSVRVPGLTADASGVVYTDVFDRNWQAIERCHVKGVLRPAELAALLPGEAAWPRGLAMEGPLAVELNVEHTGATMCVTGSLDARPATLRRAGTVIKPAGRALAASVKANLDEKTWRCDVPEEGQLRVTVGGNEFRGWGFLGSLEERLSRLSGPKTPLTLARVRQEAVGVNWTGSWTIADLPAVLELAGLPPLPADSTLKGALGGRYSIKPGPDDQPLGELTVQLPEETSLTLGGQVTKSLGRAASLMVRTQIEEAGNGLRGGELELTAGAGRLGLRGLSLRHEGLGLLRVAGSFDAQRAEDLLACLIHPLPRNARLQGDLRGQAGVVLGPGRTLHEVLCGGGLHVNASDAAIDVPGILVKKARDTATVTLELSRETASGGSQYHLTGWAIHPAGRIELTDLSVPVEGVGTWEQGRVLATVDLVEAERLPGLLPALATWLGKGRLSGAAKAELSVQWKKDHPTTARLVASALGLDFQAVFGAVSRAKRRDVPASVDLDVRADLTGEAWSLRSAAGHVQLGASSLSLEEVQAAGWIAGKAKGSADLAIEPPLTDMLPEALEWIDRYGLAGQAQVKGQIDLQPHRVGFTMDLDAGRLAAGRVDLGAKGWFLTKPGDMVATCLLAGQVARDGSEVVLDRGSLAIADAKGTFIGPVRLVRRNGRWDAAPTAEPIERLSLVAERAESLLKLCPALGVYEPAGTVRAEASGISFWPGRVAGASLECKALRGIVGGKDLRLEGALKGTQIEIARGAVKVLGTLKTDSLEWAIGKNHGFVVAEVSNIPDAATGTVQLMADYLDDKDIQDWILPPSPADQAKTLSAGQTKALHADAAHVIDRWVRPYADKAKLKLQANVDVYRSWDNDVAMYYQVRSLEGRLDLENGQLAGGYTTGLNGGSLSTHFTVNLSEPEAMIRIDKSVRDVIARENVQPQLARFFPGNAVQGLYNHSSQLELSLRDGVANAIDPRYPIYPVGKSKTYTVRGVMRGRAAPDAVIKIFPGLNLAEYPYKTMTSFSDHLADGSRNSDMVFDGQKYNLYMIGKTDAAHIGTYEVGLILNVPPQSAEFNHRTQMGRLPILKIKAR